MGIDHRPSAHPDQTPTPISIANGGTNITTYTTGDVLYASATDVLSKLAKGTDGQFLQIGATIPLWAAVTVTPTVVALVDSPTPALDASLGNVFTLAATGNRTIAVPSNATNGQKITIRHEAVSNNRTLALNTGAGGFRFGTDITALIQTVNGKVDWIGCIFDGIDSRWDVVAYVQGF